MSTLILLRHGRSDWNEKNLFTGWVDVDLIDKGREEAVRGGRLIKESGLLPDVVHTSVLRRAITTANLALDAADRHWIPVRRDWRLNERHYGALQGLDKAATRDKYGDEQFMLWRRSFDTPPPAIEPDDEYAQTDDPRYADLPEVPRTECLKDVIARLMPYWEGPIREDLAAGRAVLVTAHGNSLRALVKYLDGMSDEDVVGLNIPTGIPLRYDLDSDLKPTQPGGLYLDPEAAAAGAAAVFYWLRGRQRLQAPAAATRCRASRSTPPNVWTGFDGLAALGGFARFPPGLPSSLARCARIAPQSRPGDARERVQIG